jgi:hypothetical protein
MIWINKRAEQSRAGQSCPTRSQPVRKPAYVWGTPASAASTAAPNRSTIVSISAAVAI